MDANISKYGEQLLELKTAMKTQIATFTKNRDGRVLKSVRSNGLRHPSS